MNRIQQLASVLTITTALTVQPAVAFAADDYRLVRPNTSPDITLSCAWSDGSSGDIIYEIWVSPLGILDDNSPTPAYGSVMTAQITESQIKAQLISDDGEDVMKIEINRLSGRFTKVYQSLKNYSHYVQLDGFCRKATRKF